MNLKAYIKRRRLYVRGIKAGKPKEVAKYLVGRRK